LRIWRGGGAEPRLAFPHDALMSPGNEGGEPHQAPIDHGLIERALQLLQQILQIRALQFRALRWRRGYALALSAAGVLFGHLVFHPVSAIPNQADTMHRFS
jgi:hypothetical protein